MCILSQKFNHFKTTVFFLASINHLSIPFMVGIWASGIWSSWILLSSIFGHRPRHQCCGPEKSIQNFCGFFSASFLWSFLPSPRGFSRDGIGVTRLHFVSAHCGQLWCILGSYRLCKSAFRGGTWSFRFGIQFSISKHVVSWRDHQGRAYWRRKNCFRGGTSKNPFWDPLFRFWCPWVLFSWCASNFLNIG